MSVITAALGAEVSEDHLRPALARLVFKFECEINPQALAESVAPDQWSCFGVVEPLGGSRSLGVCF